jgi:hypothetical protein
VTIIHGPVVEIANRGIQEFYYTKNLPERAVAIAQISAPVMTPSAFTGISNTPYLSASLGVWLSSSDLTDPADFTTQAYGASIAISGSESYIVNNQYFEITQQVMIGTDGSDIPLYYKHQLPTGITTATIIDLEGNTVTDQPYQIVGSVIYHDLDGEAYRIRYNQSGYLITQLLKYTPVLSLGTLGATTSQYTFVGKLLSVYTIDTLYFRFLKNAAYQVFPPYWNPPNTPWFVRIGYSSSAFPQEYSNQPFIPNRPYLLGTWVSGKVLDSSLIEFERKQIFNSSQYLPDILVFSKDNVIKYAIEGTKQQRRGTLYNWSRGAVSYDSVDFYKARVQVSVTLDPTDIVFGFYVYREQDVIYTALDMNPHTNPIVENKIVEFYYKNDMDVPFHNIFYNIIDPATGGSVGTNDTDPDTLGTIFANVTCGSNIGVQDFTYTDVRTRGGGLNPNYQDIPQSVHFWDLGYWDGKPWPVGGTTIIYLPVSILDTIAREDITSAIIDVLPMGALPSIRFYDFEGSESV